MVAGWLALTGTLPASAAVPPARQSGSVQVATTASQIVTLPKFQWSFVNPAQNSSPLTSNVGPTDYSIYVSLSFNNVSPKTITSIRFRFFFFDASGKVAFSKTGTVKGTFSPGTTVSPRYTALNHILTLQSTDPSSPGWHFKNSLGSGLAKVSVSLDAVHYSDGTSWAPGQT
jgi:hypothetical protein